MLVGVYLFFKPTLPPLIEHSEIAQLSLKEFTLFELKFDRLVSIVRGSSGERFYNRYEIRNISLADLSQGIKQEMQAKFGRFQDDRVTLIGEVSYNRADGMAFHSEEASYDINRSVIQTKGAFTVTMDESVLEGDRLYLDTKQRTIRASSIKANYAQELP